MTHFRPSSMPPEGLGVLLLFKLIERATPGFFAEDRRIHVCRAPGRLAVLSGFSGGSDAPALEVHLTTNEAACVAVQRRDDELARLWSPTREEGRTQRLSIRLSDLGLPAAPISWADARAFLCADPRDAWCAHLLGPLLALARERGLAPPAGFDLLVHSDVPEGMGAGSSSAVAVAALQALSAAFGFELSAREVAALCARSEREVFGSDQGPAAHVTAACGEAGVLLALRGAQAIVEAELPVPDGLELVGLAVGSVAETTAPADPALGGAESDRVARFLALLGGPLTDRDRRELGETMFASRSARAASGQAREAVDLLIEAARARRQAGAPLLGASAAGRGTVVLLGAENKVWHEALRLKKALRDATGQAAQILRWSSPGAEAFGSVELTPVAD